MTRTPDAEPRTGIAGEGPVGDIHRAIRLIDERGWFPPDQARAVRAAVDHLRGEGAAPDHPAELLGPWEDLPEGPRGALRGLAGASARRSR